MYQAVSDHEIYREGYAVDNLYIPLAVHIRK